jgi:hypothetical protein
MAEKKKKFFYSCSFGMVYLAILGQVVPCPYQVSAWRFWSTPGQRLVNAWSTPGQRLVNTRYPGQR